MSLEHALDLAFEAGQRKAQALMSARPVYSDTLLAESRAGMDKARKALHSASETIDRLTTERDDLKVMIAALQEARDSWREDATSGRFCPRKHTASLDLPS